MGKEKCFDCGKSEAAIRDDYVEDLRMKKLIVSSSKKNKKTRGGSCVSSQDKKKGEVRECSQFEIELANIFQGLKDKNFPKKEIISFTDMLLDLICHWKELEKKFLDEEVIKESSFVKEPGGGFYLTSPLVVSAIKREYARQLESIYGKKTSQISDEEILKNPSSLLFQVFEGFNIFGLVTRDESRKPYRYYWDKKVLGFSFEQMSELYTKGRELRRAVERGATEGAPQNLGAGSRSGKDKEKRKPKEVLDEEKKVDEKKEATNQFKELLNVVITISVSIKFQAPEAE